MPSQPRTRVSGKLQLAALGLSAFALLAACADGPARPTLPTYSGNARPDPTRPNRPNEPVSADAFPNPYAQRRDAYVPRHLAGTPAANLKRIAVLLPFSDPNAATRNEAEGLFNAIELAVFDSGATDVVLLRRDASSDDPRAIGQIIDDAAKDGAIAVIGPFRSAQQPPITQRANQVGSPVFSFATDPSMLNQGAYLISMMTTPEVNRIVGWAASQGVTRFAMLGPSTPYGRAVEAALRAAANQNGAVMIGAAYYQPGDNNPTGAAKEIARVVNAENAASPGKVAILIPERGLQLRQVAPLLPYAGVNTREVKLLGTGAWNDSGVWREPSIYGGAFPAPDPKSIADFEARYKQVFGEAAPQLASYGYDAGALAAALARVGQLDKATLTRPQGFVGSNGLFRFGQDGAPERALAVMQIQNQGGTRVISPALNTFGPGL